MAKDEKSRNGSLANRRDLQLPDNRLCHAPSLDARPQFCSVFAEPSADVLSDFLVAGVPASHTIFGPDGRRDSIRIRGRGKLLRARLFGEKFIITECEPLTYLKGYSGLSVLPCFTFSQKLGWRFIGAMLQWIC